MPSLFLTPDWFNGIDLLFEAVGLIIAMLIAGYSWRAYKLSEETKFLYFSGAFLLVSISFLARIITSGAVYYEGVRVAAEMVLGSAVGPQKEYAILFYRTGFFVEMASLLGGWLLIFFVSQKGRERLKKYYELSQIMLFVYLVLLISVIANFKYVVFYLTGVVLLGLIVLNYYKNYLNNKNENTLLVMLAFFLILISHLLFVFLFALPSLYVVGQIFLLLGFMLLLYAYRRVGRMGRMGVRNWAEHADHVWNWFLTFLSLFRIKAEE